jgi:hypothetical protein
MRNSYKILVGIPEGRGPLGRPGHRWEDNVKIDLKEIYVFLSYLTRLSASRLYSVDGRMINEYGVVGGMRIGRGSQSTSRAYPSASLSTTNPTWPVMGLNLGCHSGKLAANHVSYGTAEIVLDVDLIHLV